ncbi:hypothetical protein LSM04_006368 [Trypanosoma melophagium]|uniref:uncharacterized protein n=1 Tax=Trypanosoma melophagium TaxID=715481 RepID=UPI00351A79A2|nr:hypothetical protein LSM04_006368 [Trypanosoma melophagium]
MTSEVLPLARGVTAAATTTVATTAITKAKTAAKKKEKGTFLAELARYFSGISAEKYSFIASRNGLNDLRVGLRGTSSMCCSTFASYGDDAFIGNRIFESPNKHVFADSTGSWCHLCREPLGLSLITHLSDREHHNHQLFLFLYAAFPRGVGKLTNKSYHPSAVLKEAALLFPKLSKAVSAGYTHTEQDALRRASLQSMLIQLSSSSSSSSSSSNNNNNNNNNSSSKFSSCTSVRVKPILAVFYGDVIPELAHSGERLFKSEVSRLIVEWFPAMGPGVITQIAHKCWGRSNLESIFDALHIQEIVDTRLHEARVSAARATAQSKGGSSSLTRNKAWKELLRRKLSTKSEKALFMRTLFWELTTRCEETSSFTEVECLLLQLVRRQLAFEMVYLQSMKYMQHADVTMREISFPSLDKLISLGIA